MKGIGIDIVEIGRIRSLTERFGARFLNKIFTAGELAHCKTAQGDYLYQSLAARFAAKEAFYKAAFPLVRKPISWLACEIINDSDRVPELQISDELHALLNPGPIMASLSHSENYAIAVVVIE